MVLTPTGDLQEEEENLQRKEKLKKREYVKIINQLLPTLVCLKGIKKMKLYDKVASSVKKQEEKQFRRGTKSILLNGASYNTEEFLESQLSCHT